MQDHTGMSADIDTKERHTAPEVFDTAFKAKLRRVLAAATVSAEYLEDLNECYERVCADG